MTARSISIDELRRLVESDPRAALAAATAQLDTTDVNAAMSAELWWIVGLSERTLGDLGRARSALESSCDQARRAAVPGLVARVTISLAFEVGHGGDLAGAIQLLDDAERDVEAGDRPALFAQRGILNYRLGRLESACGELMAARDLAHEAGAALTELQVLVNLGAIEAQRGRYEEARAALLAAVEIAGALSEVSLAAVALENLAYVETSEGNLPEALDAFAAAEDGHRLTGRLDELPRLHADHALALADANLLDDAEHLIDRAVAIAASSGNDLELAELLLQSAEIDLARGAADEAHVSAVDALAAFARQGRDSWLHVAERARLRAEARLTPADPAIAAGLVTNAVALAAGGWQSEALGARLLAALLHAEAGRPVAAQALLDEFAAPVASGRATDRLLLARVIATLAMARGDRPAARRAVTTGLRVASGSQAALGSLEARSHAAQHGAELIEIGARLAVGDGRARELLHRIEAMRTMVWRAPIVRAPDDAGMADRLTDLRRLSAAAADPDADPNMRREADRQRLQVEREVRSLSRRARGDRLGSVTTEEAVADSLQRLGDRQLLAYANLDGHLYAVGASGGRTRLHDLGPVAALDDHLEVCAFALHRLNRSQGSDASRDAAAQLLDEASTAIARLLLPGGVVRSEGPLVVVPTGVLHGVPWSALAPLRGRAVSVSPSLSAWASALDASMGRPAGPRRTRPSAFVAGPDLQFAEQEIGAVARSYVNPRLFAGAEASAERTLETFGDVELIHLACHGKFRTDNPLFSTLSLADGPLTVYDLERAAAMPEVVVLSACSVGTSAAINGGTLLGLSSALAAFGASDVIAPLTPVNDERVVAVMRRLHSRLAAGDPPSVALAAAAVGEDGALDPAGAAFVVLGA